MVTAKRVFFLPYTALVQSTVLILTLNKDYGTTEEILQKSHRVIKRMRKTPPGKRFESTCDQKEE